MDIPVLCLKKNQDRRARAGHSWIYSNEVDTGKTPLQGLQPGETVAIMNHQEKWLGWAYVNPNSLICARITSRSRDHLLDQSLLVHRIKIALSLRERLYPGPYYRLVFAESDGLPGLVVDRYGDYLAVQLSTAGMEMLRDEIIAALEKVLKPKGIVLRNDVPVREMEGLDRYVEVAAGYIPELVDVIEGDCRFQANLLAGQKTGWFYDQAANRQRMLPYVRGRKVLDLFSYTGAWGIRAVQAGAESATCVDASASALEQVQNNAAMNNLQDQISNLQGDAFTVVKGLKQSQQRFDVIVVDPPAFIKRRKDMKEGTLAYRRINEAAMGLLSRDGLLISASCSFHMAEDRLLQTLQQAARHMDRSMQLLEKGQQGPDHPVHPAIPETAYLKANFLRVLPAF